MLKPLSVAVLLLSALATVGAQRSRTEDEVRLFVTAYDSAVAARDIAFLTQAIATDYVLTGAGGRKSDRTSVLAYYAQQRVQPSYRIISLKHDNIVVRAVSNMAVVTNDYVSETMPVDAPTAEPETTKGRHTGVFAKRNGRWLVIAEQDTEEPHDAKTIERQVAKSGRDYYELMRRLRNGRPYAALEQSGDIASLSRMLTDAFSCTCGDTTITRKPQALGQYASGQVTLDTIELLEQSVVAIDNNAAVESGKVHYVGRDGARRIDIVKRYTTAWVSWGQGWQIVAQHVSPAND
jgi:ketosteroid isomerase-like protein